MLTLQISAHALHKEGTEPRQCEDACAYDAARGLAAIADGASDAFESGAWARLLVTTFIHNPPADDPTQLAAWVAGPARAWHASLHWEDMAWYADQKAREVGGLATLLGFHLEQDAPLPGMWHALAVGDACLLHLRDRAVLTRFPVLEATAFDATPTLLSTHPAHNETLQDGEDIHVMYGSCRAGDIFLLATDALAEWLYTIPSLHDETSDLPDWHTLTTLLEEDFEAVINQLRTHHALRNDDVTLLVLRVVETGEATESDSK
jgi:hypothetical protein